MIVPVQALQEGCIVKTDIYSLAPTPLIKSHTVLKETHLAFLKAFSIKEIDIEYALADGDSFHPADLSEVEPDADEVNPSFFIDTMRQFVFLKDILNHGKQVCLLLFMNCEQLWFLYLKV
ncbi:hypothetical protein [Alkalicoccobacillus plakortidis]|uniref:Uncharacterized protein n=1 Tax=Alkalicoccobacillus plakortidis TaxID=444060 RepID=A0ABT0XKU9_9BACI|nr:hypothetical protein [Alkalicoccobacillus plakortidis]MCM2676462.1 hypothetical protein [Alkalicoccobacillus plakortidis]